MIKKIIKDTFYFVIAIHLTSLIAYGLVELFINGYYYLPSLILIALIGAAIPYALNSIDKNSEAKRKEVEND